MTVPDTALKWRKSSSSGQATDCVEVAFGRRNPEDVFVRDSKNRPGPKLVFPASAWLTAIHDHL